MGDRLLSIDGIPLHGASHATAIATLQQCSHEALFQVEYDVTTPGALESEGKGWGRKRSQRLSTTLYRVILGQCLSFSEPLECARHLLMSLGIMQEQCR